MNNQRREQISQLSTKLNILKEKIEELIVPMGLKEDSDILDSDVKSLMDTQVEITFQISKRKHFKSSASVLGWLEDIQGDIETIKDEEQEYIDNLPESLQGGEKASMAEEAVSNLDDAYSHMEEAVASFQEPGESFTDPLEALENVISSIDSVE
jgi:hypothetical protein